MYNSGDCRDGNGTLGRCVAGAINNYTTQLLSYGNKDSDSQCKQTLPRLLLFLFILQFSYHG